MLTPTQLLGHPVTHRWISNVDQSALTFLESVTVSKALSRAGATTACAAQADGGVERVPMEWVKHGVNGSSYEDLDEDDVLGYRITFVSALTTPPRGPLLPRLTRETLDVPAQRSEALRGRRLRAHRKLVVQAVPRYSRLWWTHKNIAIQWMRCYTAF